MTDDRLILVEQPEGIPWVVAHWAAGKSVYATPAPPDWASQELRDAITGMALAGAATQCSRCEAVRPAPVHDGDGPTWLIGVGVPHAVWCAYSDETVCRLEEACRPRGTRWVADTSDETMAELRWYVYLLVKSFDGCPDTG